MAELVDAQVSEACDREIVVVRFHSSACNKGKSEGSTQPFTFAFLFIYSALLIDRLRNVLCRLFALRLGDDERLLVAQRRVDQSLHPVLARSGKGEV